MQIDALPDLVSGYRPGGRSDHRFWSFCLTASTVYPPGWALQREYTDDLGPTHPEECGEYFVLQPTMSGDTLRLERTETGGESGSGEGIDECGPEPWKKMVDGERLLTLTRTGPSSATAKPAVEVVLGVARNDLGSVVVWGASHRGCG